MTVTDEHRAFSINIRQSQFYAIIGCYKGEFLTDLNVYWRTLLGRECTLRV